MENLNKNILKYRKENNMTQKDLAELLKVSASSISKWETGNAVPDIGLLIPLANAFGISVDELLSFNLHMDDNELKSLKNKVTKIILDSNYKKGMSLLDNSIDRYPNDNRLILFKSQLIQMYAPIYLNKDELKVEYKKALNLLDNIIDMDDPIYKNISIFIKINILIELDNIEEAEKSMNILMDNMSRTYIDPSFLQIKIYEIKGDNKKLENFAKSKLLFNVNNSIALLNVLSRNETGKSDYDKSKFYLKSAAEIENVFKTNLYSSHYNLCKSYYDDKDYEKSVKYFYKFSKGITSFPYDYKGHEFFHGLKLNSSKEEQKTLRIMMIQEILEEFNHEKLYEYEEYRLAVSMLKDYIR